MATDMVEILDFFFFGMTFDTTAFKVLVFASDHEFWSKWISLIDISTQIMHTKMASIHGIGTHTKDNKEKPSKLSNIKVAILLSSNQKCLTHYDPEYFGVYFAVIKPSDALQNGSFWPK